VRDAVVCEDRDIGGLLPEQSSGSAHRGSHARLLAGPGTGKTTTLVEHVVGLIHDGVPANQILCLTFTRAAAAGFRKKVVNALAPGAAAPEVYTLHAFALRVLMKRRADIGSGKGRARVADDWEERFIVREDLRRILSTKLDDVKKRLAVLSAAWETAPAVPPTVDPPLLGALRLDKARYGYVLRAELVFDLYQELGSDPSLLRGEYLRVVVDEYQDLNRCDVAVIDQLGERGAQLYVAGDDDQSIYQQLRHAHPQAIRDFVTNHVGAADLKLATCVRCDSEIIKLAQEVIAAEPGRIAKPLNPHSSAGPGKVELLTFPTQSEEAQGIAILAKKFVDAGVPYEEIMILLRSDHQGRFSEVIEAALSRLAIPSVVRTAEKSALATKEGRYLLAHLRLRLDPSDDLAWRTVLDCGSNGIGEKTIEGLHALGDSAGIAFGETVARVAGDGTLVARGALVADEYAVVTTRLAVVDAASPVDVEETIEAFARELPSTADLEAARAELVGLARSYLAIDLAEFLVAIALKKEEEQSITPNTVNILTMHRAKGLDACVVFVPGAEDEIYIRDASGVDEARRLFYVSITRAKHGLFVSHAVRRTGLQRHSGGPGIRRRTGFLLTRGPSSPGLPLARAFAVDPALLTSVTGPSAT
jgi:DNA helicase-2/ATP-dependent DNA helicase PcrA